MGLLTAILAILGTFVVGLVTKVAADEFAACASSWARQIVRRAALSLPEGEHDAFLAEWLAYIDDMPGNVSKLLHACSLWRKIVVEKRYVNRSKHALSSFIASLNGLPFFDVFKILISSAFIVFFKPGSETRFDRIYDFDFIMNNYVMPVFFIISVIVSSVKIVDWSRARTRNLKKSGTNVDK